MSKKPGVDKSKSAADSTSAAASSLRDKSKRRVGESSAYDSDDSDKEATHATHAADSDDDEADSAAARKAASDSLEKSELAAYLSTPSVYSGAGLTPLSASESAARSEVEELLSRLKGHQREMMQRRAENQKELESMKTQLKKVRKDTDELLKSQQTNLATMGRKLR